MAVCSVKDGNLEEAIKLVKSGCEAHRLKKNRTLLPIRVTLSPDTFNLHIQGEVQQCAFAMLRDGTKSISMRQALEIRSGWNTDNFRRATQDLNFVTDVRETDCLSIILRHPIRHYKTIDLVFNTTDVQLAWMAVLNHVIDKMKEESSHLRITWLRRKFYEGDVNKNGFLNFKEVWKLVFSLNLELKESVAMDIFQKSDFKKTGDSAQCLDFEEFVHFFRFLTDRPDLKRVLRRFSAKHCEYFTVNDLQRFLQTEQGFADITLKECQELIKKYECEDSFAKASLMSRYGLRKLLYTKYGTIFNPELKKIYMNMTLPLPNYFICSTHNTYLCGHQLVGDATIEGYIMALKKGARLLEIDMYDGAEAPVVTHGRTLVKPVLLQDVLHSIRTFGFSISPYPLILSLENHCSQDQQDVVVNIFEEILGDKIYRWKQQSTFPSPEQLKEKILIKCKPTPVKRFSDLISIVPSKVTDYVALKAEYPVNCMISKTEDEFQQLAECDAEDLIRFTSKYLMKGYPRGTRTASTNFNPVPQWLCGIQAVCLNVQTADEATDLNAAMFELNGRTGFVLKPEFMLKREKKAAKRLQPLTLNVEVIAGFFLPKPSTAESYAEVIDPYVSVELFGTIEDCIKFKTGVIWNNGFNPMWNETFNIYVREPELAFLRFCVKDFNRKAQNDFIGQYTLPVVAIRDGYSHVRLETGFQHATDPTATLFVRIKRSVH